MVGVQPPYMRRSEAGVNSGIRNTLSLQYIQDISNALIYQQRTISNNGQHTHIYIHIRTTKRVKRVR